MTSIVELRNYRIRYTHVSDHKPVFVTFEPFIRPDAEPDPERLAWGEAAVTGMGFSVLGIIPRGPNWYRTPDLWSFLDFVRASGMLQRYPRAITYGSSAGGYAAAAFASLIGASDVLALNPFSTLNPKLAPWETRFPRFRRRLNWTANYHDAAAGLSDVQRLCIVFDPAFNLDALHAQRLIGRATATRTVELPGVGHHTPRALKDQKSLKPLITEIAAAGDAEVMSLSPGRRTQGAFR